MPTTLQCWLTHRSTGPIAAGRHLGYKSLAQMPTRRNGPVSSNVRPHILKAVPAPSSVKTTKWRLVAVAKLQVFKIKPRSTSMSSRMQQIGPLGSGNGNQEQRSYVPTQQRQASNYCFSFRSCPTKVIQARGWRFALACCAT